jgi:predicted phosphodiesterase
MMFFNLIARVAITVTGKWWLALAVLLFVSPGFGQGNFKITHGPYLQALHQTGVTIVWTTDAPSTGWVELLPDDSTHFYQKERPKFYSSSHGFKNISKVHKVALKGLKPGTSYRYRVYSQEILSHVGANVRYGKVAATEVYRKEPLRFSTAASRQEKVVFGMINDIHGRNEVMEKLLANLDFKKTDLVFFNGDMANDLRSEDQMFTDFMDTGVKVFASEVPMYYARGNHETRGQFAAPFPDYFTTTTGQLYYLVRRGPICFVVLDCGEDKPDSDIEYSGIVNMDFYRSEQADWLKEALQHPDYVNAPYKVVICHMPPFGGWHGEREIAEKFVPLLNEAGAQVMLSGHLHRHVKAAATTDNHRFPVLVNSNNNMLRATADSKSLRIEVVDQQGKVVDSLELSPSK